jgi:prepilin-type N-terminal cleavage/methylation domain-containing protein
MSIHMERKRARRRRREIRDEQGMTLIELVTALFVVGVGVFGALQMYQFSLDQARHMGERATARQIVQGQLENLRAAPFDTLQDGEGIPFSVADCLAERLVNMEARMTVMDRSADTAGLKEVSVTVRWTGAHGRTIEAAGITMIARKR